MPEMAEVARWLRQSRHQSGLTYEQLVRATGFSKGRLNRAANGWRSSWPVVKAFTRACGTDVDTARMLWLRAKEAMEATDPVPDVIAVEHVGTFDELRVAMGHLRVLAGRPSLRELVDRSEGRLRRSTLASVFRGTSHPRRELVTAFVNVVGVGSDDAADWVAAWDRAQAHLRDAREAMAPRGALAVMPSPALLSVLGDLPQSEWAAVAEVVDVVRQGREEGTPAVAVDFQHDGTVRERVTITISCPGTGFDRDAIQQLFRISWAGTPLEQNVFGPGFLAACLRLGSRITLRTTQRHEPAWTVLTLDLASLSSGSAWRIPIGAEPKTETGQQGISITVEALRSAWPPNMQHRLRRHLGDVYSYMLREEQLQLTVSEVEVAPRKPCIWGENRFVQRRGQNISAVQKIDVVLATLYRCQDCWHTSPLGSSFCLQCGGTRLKQTEYRVWGWLGVQRYLHQRDYGIDFYRNGRKILARDKQLFSFGEGPEGVMVEYPADPPAKGRLVGEIHCDHVPVNFTHTAFVYDSPEWRGVVHAVRGRGPLAPGRAERLGFAPNTSPLATLFGAFRRNSPGLRCLIPGDGARALHETAATWAERFHKGDPAYQSDDAWYAAAFSHDAPSPGISGVVDDRIDLVHLDPEDLGDLVHRLYMHLHDPAEGPRELIGRGAAAAVFRGRPRSGERWVLQTRCSQHVVPLETVHALAGQMLDVQAVRGILVTTSWFGASSRAFVARSGRIDLVDGRALKALLHEHLGIEARLRLKRLPPEWDVGDLA